MLEHITVSSIEEVVTIDSPRARRVEMRSRWCWGLSFCESGSITYFHKGRSIVSQPGTAVLLPKGEDYTLYCSESGHFPVINFQCLTPPEKAEFQCIALRHPEEYLREFARLQQMHLLHRDPAGCMSILYGILSALAGECRRTDPVPEAAIRWMEERLFDPELQVAQLAEKTGISEVSFRRLFQQAYGMTPKQYICSIRLRRARQLLAESRMPIGAVAAECGFASLYHFSRAFHEAVGISPSEYRARAGVWGL
jgi:AraC-like DNA-binding protein